MGEHLYIICEDGEFLSYGKEIEVYLNKSDAVAMLMFILDKRTEGKEIYISRHGLHQWHENMMKKDVSEEYTEYAKEELHALGDSSSVNVK